jgi:hypothetical protein
MKMRVGATISSECDREERSFIFVAPTVRVWSPTLITCITSSGAVTNTCTDPSIHPFPRPDRAKRVQ